LLLALLRLVEPAAGKIFIDGVDVSTLGLHTLRSRFAIIPQDAFCWTGTLRAQLDPFEVYSDAQIWDVLRKAFLMNTMERLPLKLQTKVQENGDNFSVSFSTPLHMYLPSGHPPRSSFSTLFR
jgi:ABC-type multidrug transport system fused ATPase/permease subunit